MAYACYVILKRLLIMNIAYDIIILGTRTHDQFLQLLRILLRIHNSIVNSGQVETEKLKFGNGRQNSTLPTVSGQCTYRCTVVSVSYNLYA